MYVYNARSGASRGGGGGGGAFGTCAPPWPRMDIFISQNLTKLSSFFKPLDYKEQKQSSKMSFMAV